MNCTSSPSSSLDCFSFSHIIRIRNLVDIDLSNRLRWLSICGTRPVGPSNHYNLNSVIKWEVAIWPKDHFTLLFWWGILNWKCKGSFPVLRINVHGKSENNGYIFIWIGCPTFSTSESTSINQPNYKQHTQTQTERRWRSTTRVVSASRQVARWRLTKSYWIRVRNRRSAASWTRAARGDGRKCHQ